MANGWSLWVWLECIGVVIIIITFPTPLVLALFLPAASLFFVNCFNVFCSCLCYFCKIYSQCCSKNIRDRSKIEIRE